MPQQRTTIWEELTAAAQGVVALVTGNRKASGYFDFSQRGLVGSFIAVLVMVGINALVPMLSGIEAQTGSAAKQVLGFAILFALQIAFSAIVLNQIKRLDGLLPYLVADNWSSFFLSLLATLLGLLGVDSEFMLLVMGIVVIIVEINIARLIVTLTPLQIAMFIIAQLVGVSIGLVVVSLIVPAAAADLGAFSNLPA